jgi:hypothetical protein
MIGGSIIRRLAGAVRNGVVWGAAWFGLAMVGFGALRILNDNPVSLLDAIGMSIRIGIVGGLTGGAFAAFISFFYRGKRLSEISPARFGFGGGIVALAFMMAWLGLLNLLTGGSIPPWKDIDSDLFFATLFGAISAGGSMWLAQRGAALPDETEAELHRLQAGDDPELFTKRTPSAAEPDPRRDRMRFS